MRIRCIDTGEVYATLKDAARDMKVNASSLSSVCSGRRLTAGGYRFEYATDSPTKRVERVCRCGNTFMPERENQLYCCKACGVPASSKRIWHVKLGDSIPSERPFTFETNLMIVTDAMRGKPLSRTAKATGRPIDEVTAQYELLVHTGVIRQYETIIKTAGLVRHVASSRIA